MRVISVVIGEENSKTRFDDVRTMFDYAFANYSVCPIIEANKPLERTINVSGGKQKTVEVYPQRSSYAFSKRGEKANVKWQTSVKTLRAPVKKGDIAGEIVIFKDNVEIDRVNLVAAECVAKATFFDRIGDVARAWNARK